MDDRFSGRIWQALVLGAAVVLLLTRLGGTDLWAPDEPRYAQVAEEVRTLDHGISGLFLLRLNGQIYDQKPPLYYWMAALAGTPTARVTEVAARLPSALSGVALVALVLFAGSRWVGRASATFGAGILLTSALFPHIARRAQLDVQLALFEALALVGFWRLDRGEGSRRNNLLLLHASMGLAVLTKGPVGIVLPALTMAAYLAWEGRFRSLAAAFPWRMLGLSVLPGLLWILLATALAPDGYFQTAVIDNIADHFLTGASKSNPWWYFLVVLPPDLLPWTLLWPLVWIVGRREIFAPDAAPEPRRAWRFLLAWAGVSLVFFSLSSGKRAIYLLPSYAAVSLLCGDAAIRALRRRARLSERVTRGLVGVAILAALAALALAALPVVPNVDVPFTFMAVVWVGLALSAWLFARAGARGFGATGQLAAVFVGVFAVELALFTLFFPALQDEKSPRPVALAAAALAPPGSPIGLVEMGPATGGLVYYSGRPVQEIGPVRNLRAFFASGGAVAVVRGPSLASIGGEEFSEIRARFRTGERQVLVVTPRHPAAR